jgi:DNA processing protein
MNNVSNYQLALTLIKDIGPITGRQLVSFCGSAEAVFRTKKSLLEGIPGVGSIRANAILKQKQTALLAAEKEIKFVEKEKVQLLWFQDSLYPKRLLHCVDAPLLLYHKGTCDLNNPKTIGIVGTRRMTDYGRMLCEKLVEELIPIQPLIISGLAYGIDIVAHKAAVKNKLDTIAVVANGLNKMYPATHIGTLKEMMKHGGVLTEYTCDQIADKENFPQRNRIVAGMCDAMIVVETARKGGAMITASLANGYNRDVFTYPGDVNKPYSQGCNYLIKSNQAHLIESAKDVIEMMNWEDKVVKRKPVQKTLFLNFTLEEQKVVDVLQIQSILGIDEIAFQTQQSHSTTAAALLGLELQGIVQAMPGKMYKIC